MWQTVSNDLSDSKNTTSNALRYIGRVLWKAFVVYAYMELVLCSGFAYIQWFDTTYPEYAAQQDAVKEAAEDKIAAAYRLKIKQEAQHANLTK